MNSEKDTELNAQMNSTTTIETNSFEDAHVKDETIMRIQDSTDKNSPEHADKELCGLGGWLLVVGLGRVLAPLSIIRLIISDVLPIFTNGYITLVSTPGHVGYSPLWKPFFSFELIGNSIYFGLCIYLLVLFFQKKKSFPKWFIGAMLYLVVFSFIDNMFAGYTMYSVGYKLDKPMLDFIRASAYALLWIPYTLKSVRVRNTFVN